MRNKVTEERAEFLINEFFEFSFKNKTPNKELFDAITEPIELHFIAENYNWDDGIVVLNWIINNPICDKGTARLIFWRSEPNEYSGYSESQDIGLDYDVYTLLKNIIYNFENDFYNTDKIYFDPNSKGRILEDLNVKWKIPKSLISKGKGKIVLNTIPTFAELIKSRKNSLDNSFVLENQVLYFKPKTLKINILTNCEVTSNQIFEDFLNEIDFPSTVKSNFLSSASQIKKALYPPICILKRESNIILFYTFIRKVLTGESLVNVANLVWYDSSLINAFVQTKLPSNGLQPKRFKIGLFRAALSNPFPFEYRKINSSKIKTGEISIFYIDKQENVLAFYLIGKLTEEEIIEFTKSIEFD